MTDATPPDLRLPSQPQSVTVPWPIPNYTACQVAKCLETLGEKAPIGLLLADVGSLKFGPKKSVEIDTITVPQYIKVVMWTTGN